MSIEIESGFNGLNGHTNGSADYAEVNGLGVVIPSTSSGSLGDTNTNTSSSSSNGEDLNNYDTVFPSLPSTGTNMTISNAWNNTENKLSIKRHTTTQVFHVPVEERKHNNASGSFGNETNKRCEEIANRLGVKVEICCSKDLSLHIVITGQEEKVLEAKRAIINEIQTECDQKVKVPKDQHKYLIGKGGAVLKELQEKCCVKIQVPKSDSQLDYITITGPKDGIEQAVHEIQLICDEQSKTGMERLAIPKIFHPWIRGINNEIANEIGARTGAKINIPPTQIEKDEIVISGDREKVDMACREINQIFREKSKLNITKLAIQITKSQHKLIIGKNGSTVHDIFRDFDVYVQVPKLDSPSETIFLFGEESKLGAALSQVCAKANSVVTTRIDVPSWLHRHMIGEKGANISKITADYPNTHVKFEADNKITLDGPPEEVEKVRERLQNITIGLKQIMTCEEINVDPKFYSQLVGKKYDNSIARLNKEYGVVIRLPNENATNNLVRIEGASDAVAKAKAEFNELLKKLENERSKDVIIEQKYHSNIIGKNGKNLNEIRAKFNDIQINIPSVQEKSDIITIRGNKLDVEKCFKHLTQLAKEMQESNYSEDIQIFKEFHRIIIGKGGAFIKKIRDEAQVRIEVPAENSDSNSITIVGKQENVFKARKMLEEKIKELVNIKEDFVEIPHQLHTALIGKGGAIIKQIRKDCGGVIINFPPETTPTDKITIRGPIEEIKKAKQELLKLAEQKNDISYSEDIIAKSEFHRFLVGHKGNNINALREQYNVRVLFPSQNSAATTNEAGVSTNDIITILGKKENVKAVRAQLEASIKNLEEQTTDEVHVDPKWHKNFISKRAKLINKISDENCNVRISFPKAPNSNVVTIKGPKDAVESAKKRILEHVHDFENQVTIELVIPQKYHVAVIGNKGINSQQISDDFKVEIQFPAKSTTDENNEVQHNNGIENGTHDNETANSPSKSDKILISGLKEDCEKAKEAILALVPKSEEFAFPKKFHKELISNKAEILINISNNFNVKVVVPKKGDESDLLTLIGTTENLEEAKKALKETLEDLELKNFSVEISNVKPELISELRGRKGAEVARLEKKYNVKIDFSRIGEPEKIIIRGLQKEVLIFKAYIDKKIQEDESKVSEEITIDNKVHSRIIGYQGKALAKIQEKFKVDIKFSGRNSDTVIVKGNTQDQVEEACDHLKNLEEEYLQDVIDKEAYTHPSRQSSNNEANTNGQSKGFVVRNAPWEQNSGANARGGIPLNPDEPAPDTSNMEDFPTITAALTGPGSAQKTTWGPSRK